MSEKSEEAPIVVRRVHKGDILPWSEMRRALWPETPREEHLREIEGILKDEALDAFVAIDAAGRPVGFVELSLRPYVNGCHSHPVAFVEGIWIQDDQRSRGIGRLLINRSIEWAQERGVGELASDVDQENHNSIAAHRAWGFEETERVVYFRRPVDNATEI